MANLSYDIPFTLETPTNIGSVSKQFTAMAILLLEQEGKLSLDDDVREHIPELPDFGHLITVKNLLNHTNGFREVFNLLPLTGWKGEDDLRREEVIEIIKRQEELQNLPGEKWTYNNSAYIMAAEIVERVSEKDFPEWMEENIFRPLEMTSTVVRKDPNTIIPGASQGYSVDESGLEETGDLDGSYGAGGIYTTVDDLARWMKNFHDPVLGNEEVIQKLITLDTLLNGDTMSYALGIFVGEYQGATRYEHGGSDLAHQALLTYFPGLDIGVATMSNHANFNTGQISYAAIDGFFGDLFESDEEDPVEGETAEEKAPKLAKLLREEAKVI
jgi:CubicO group peptidase (beta-lactamase class C family)